MPVMVVIILSHTCGTTESNEPKNQSINQSSTLVSAYVKCCIGDLRILEISHCNVSLRLGFLNAVAKPSLCLGNIATNAVMPNVVALMYMANPTFVELFLKLGV